MDPWVRKGLLVSRSLGHKDHKDHRASLVRRDLRAHKDLLVPRVLQELQVLKERGETLDSLATPELDGGLDGRDTQELRVQWASRVLQELPELRGPRVILEAQATLVHLDRTGSTGLV